MLFSSDTTEVQSMFSCPVCTTPQSRWGAFFRSGVRGFYRCPYCHSHLQVGGRMVSAAVAALVALGFVALNLTVPVYFDNKLYWLAFQVFTVLLVYFGLLAWLMRVERRQPTRRFMP
ncbi:MAG: hypothetical protein ACP5EP_07490 [Acidobacteriaceae bacterium]